MPDPNSLPNEAVRAQLDRVLHWQGFSDSPQLGRFLRHVVEQELSGNAASIKEYSIGLEVFNRSSSFDPKSDSIVRSEARRLRAKLAEYYSGEGAPDPLRIEVPKGGYLPLFSVRNGAETVPLPVAETAGKARSTVLRWPIGAVLVGLVLIALANGARLQGAQIGPRVRFGEDGGRQCLAAREARQPMRALLLRASGKNQFRRDFRARAERAHADIGARQFLGDDAHRQFAETAPAIFLG